MTAHVARLLQESSRPLMSIEFFPPKTEKGMHSFYAMMNEIKGQADYISVTQHVGGKVGNATQNLVTEVIRQHDITVVPHITGVGVSMEDTHNLIHAYQIEGVHNVLALRGDGHTAGDGEFSYAYELVRYVRETFPGTSIGAAAFPEGHPECPNRLQEIIYLKSKVDAGADYLVTQLFFDNRDFFDFVNRCHLAGITVPIVAGILPIVSIPQMERMAELAAGARIPATLLKEIHEGNTPDKVYSTGIAWAKEQVRELYDAGFPIHIYSLNNRDICVQMLEYMKKDGED